MTESIIVADSGPLIGLAGIGQLELLRRLAERVVVPGEVWREVTGNLSAPGAKVVSEALWMEVESPAAAEIVSLTMLVDRGEAEAIALAVRHTSSVLLLDDARARRVAEHMKLRRMGTVGLLRRAKQQGLIDRLRPQLEALVANGIFIRQALIDAVLKDVGE